MREVEDKRRPSARLSEDQRTVPRVECARSVDFRREVRRMECHRTGNQQREEVRNVAYDERARSTHLITNVRASTDECALHRRLDAHCARRPSKPFKCRFNVTRMLTWRCEGEKRCSCEDEGEGEQAHLQRGPWCCRPASVS